MKNNNSKAREAFFYKSQRQHKQRSGKMDVQGIRKSLWDKMFVFVLALGFVLCGGIGRIYAEVSTTSDKLSTRKLKENGQLGGLIGSMIKGANGQKDGGILGYESDPNLRLKQIETLLKQIDRELEKPGTGDLPVIAALSDYHGDVNRFAELLSGLFNKVAGFKGKLDPMVSIEKQLNAQGLSLKTEEQLKAQGLSFKSIKIIILLNGDLLDRGKDGIKCFNIAKELIDIAPDKVLYNSGNHDLWAFLNLMGFHLPWYEGYNFYEDKEAAMIVKLKAITEPRFFHSPNALNLWTEKLAEYNEFQTKFQKEFLSGKATEIREKFVKNYVKFSKNWNKEQIQTWEFFAGHFASLDVPDPEVGLNGMGKTSTTWWKDIHQQLMKGREARSNTGADADELAAWDEAIVLADQIAGEVENRLKQAMSRGEWWYRIFESINNKAYESVEWWGKDWSSHKGWGEAVLSEINDMSKKGLIKGEQELTQANYIQSPTLKSLADFYRKNFNLYLKDTYGNLITHGWLPVADNGQVTITYKGKEYSGQDVVIGLDAISNDIKDTSKSLKDVWEGLNIVNSWYADKTTTLKPKNVKNYREKIGLAKIQSNLGVRNWLTGHNPLNKLKTTFMNIQDGYAHFELDKGMADKFGHEGAYVLIGPDGIKAYGFEAKASTEIVEAPKTIIAGKEGAAPTVFNNEGFSAKEFLTSAKKALEEEFAAVLGKPQVNFDDVNAVNDALKGIVQVSPAGAIKIENAGLLREVLIDKLVYDATFNPNAEIKALTRKLVKDIAAAQGAVLGSVYDLYVQKAKDPTNYSVPAINIRGNAYNTAQAVFESAIANKVGIFIAEIAKSEIGYTGQRPAEYTTTVLAAAIKAGWNQPVFIQGDHFQIDLKKYKVNPDEARDEIKKLIREAVAAGFYQIDLDMSVLVDFERATELEQQKENGTETAILTAYVRALERELGLDKLGIVVNLGGEIGEIGKGVDKAKQRNSTVADLKAFLAVYRAELDKLSKEAGYVIKPITKIAIQTGTKHGGIRNAEGKVGKAKVSFNTLGDVGQAARDEEGLAGVVQHGASTLDTRAFVVFAGNEAPQGFEIDKELLNAEGARKLATNPTAEVHLATQYQDVIYDHPLFPVLLRDKIREFIFNKVGIKTDEADAEGKYVENRKTAWGPFKQQLWNMPSDIQSAIKTSLRQQFDIVFNNLGVKDSQIFLTEALAKPRLNFADVKSVNDALAGIVEVKAKKGIKILNAGLLREVLIDKLVYDATFNPNAEVVALTRKLIKDIAAAQGAVLGSVYDLYVQKAKDPTNYSVPAINVRGMGYNTAQPIFESAIANNVGIFILEIAKSEIGYSGQRPGEYTTSMLAAAIKTGYDRPVYLQGDHFQIDLKKYTADPEKARNEIKDLIREAIKAGFYQIDLDMSVLVDFNRATELEQQKENGTESAILTAYVRALERELGLDKLGIVVNLGGEIGEIGKGLEKEKQRNSSKEDFDAYWKIYTEKLAELSKEAGYEIKPITKIAIQTGTKHGGVRDSEGKIGKAKVSFNTIGDLSEHVRKYGLAGAVQHGASTLPEVYFVLFAGNEAPKGFVMDETLLNAEGMAKLKTNPAAEVHLATKYQDVIMEHPAFPALLRDKIREFIFNKIGVKADEAGAESKYVDNRKNAWGPFKQQLWNLPSDTLGAIRSSLLEQFDIVFNNLGVKNTESHVSKVFVDAIAPRVDALSANVFNKNSWEFENLVKSIMDASDNHGVAMFSANDFFTTPGLKEALAQIKALNSFFRIAVWVAKGENTQKDLDTLKSMGVDKVADTISVGLNPALDAYKYAIENKRAALAVSEADLENIKAEFNLDDAAKFFAQNPGLKQVKMQESVVEGAELSGNSASLIVGLTVASVLSDQPAVVKAYEKQLEVNVVANQIPAATAKSVIANLGELEISTPMVARTQVETDKAVLYANEVESMRNQL